jgi:histidine ammonia-lyase
MLCLAASLARALSGVRPIVIERLLALLNHGLTPVVPEIGSVGASGDLAPLAHIALVLMGEGSVIVRGRELPSASAMRRVGLAPIELATKEGLALINGTHLMTARLALLRVQWERLLPAALLATAMSLDACRATDAFLDPRVYAARNQPGANAIAAELRRLIHGSRILPSHRRDDPRVQDPYSFRCAAIVLGSVCDSLASVWSALDHELGAVTDNPLVFPRAKSRRGEPVIVSAGNFHGMPVALPLDILAIGLAHVAGIAERRVYHMISAFDPESHLNPFLTPHPGLESGLMITQYTAAAACNELIGLAAPATVANLSTCAGMEDYNSFGPRSAAKAERALDLVTTVVAIELLCAAQGLEYHRPLRSSPAVETAHALIRRRVKKLTADRPLAPDIEAIRQMISAGEFRAD